MTSLPICASKTVKTVEVFTTDAYPFEHDARIHYCNLDQLSHLENSIQGNVERFISNPDLMTQYNQPLTQALSMPV